MNQTPSEHNAPQRAFHYQNAHWLWLSALVILADQVTKQLVVNNMVLFDRIPLTGFLNLVHVHNTGAAFSMFAGAAPFFFVALSVAVSVGILVWLRRYPHEQRLVAVSLTLILGGALGNAIDRATRGYVIDFIDVHVMGWHWPAFNVADSAITVGAVLLIVDMLIHNKSTPSN